MCIQLRLRFCFIIYYNERRLVQDLNGDGESTVSFIEQGITVFEKREEDKTGNLQKRKIIH